ncbi:phage coat protein [Ralstonia syzygii]|uniref:Putative minor coat protein n=1 Tax=Ralstonia syzygii R24 TaxID=907261 RepID=G3A0F2_9RALS|nr:phage coat protein [Ralstonia syzygii]CCA84649.1 putative minor coat protein [Ralstonia syzygii R24]
MAQCVQVVSGQLQLDSSPVSSCTGYLLLTADEVTLLHALPALSASDGALIGAAILGVWGLAFVFRSLKRLFFQSEEE